jgi:hypothetical protein
LHSFEGDQDTTWHPSTPNKRPRLETEHTPRPSKILNLDRTPRSYLSGAKSENEGPRGTIRGYTLSHLRRVPELSSLARRVVRVEAKRRAKEATGKHLEKHVKSKDENSDAKMQRLFMWALRKLREEGSIVLWDGPVRSSNEFEEGRRTLWKCSSSDVDRGFSMSGVVRGEEANEELSDPQEEEEAYIPLTPQYLAEHVEGVVRVLEGASKGEITRFLRRSDDRWGRVGEWVVEEAIKLLKDDGRVWHVGCGKWEVCL